MVTQVTEEKNCNMCGHSEMVHTTDGKCSEPDCNCKVFAGGTPRSPKPSGGVQFFTSADATNFTVKDSATIRFGSGDHIEPFEIMERVDDAYGPEKKRWDVYETCPGRENRLIASFYIQAMATRLCDTLNNMADDIYQAVQGYRKLMGGSVAEILEMVRLNVNDLPEIVWDTSSDAFSFWLGPEEGKDDGDP